MTPLPEFDRVFAQHHRSLYGFLVRMTGRAEVAEELLQETFVRYARHRDRLPADANLRAWLFTVARNLYRSHRRWAWLDGQRLAELAARAVGVDPGPTPSEVLAATQTQRAVEGALAAMPDTLREVAVLVWTQHLTPRRGRPRARARARRRAPAAVARPPVRRSGPHRRRLPMSEDVPPGWLTEPALEPARADALRRAALAAARTPPWVVPEATLAAVSSVLLVAWALHAVWA